MSEEIRVLLYPVDNYDRRKDAEFIENNLYSIHLLETLVPTDVEVYTLSDFMDGCNNQEINLELYWVSYIRLKNEN
jgi:hypothetical protein